MRVLVVDDEPLARGRLVRMLHRLGVTDVAEAEDGARALGAVEADPPDVLLLDIRMPGVDGLAVARALEGRTAVIFVTAWDAHALEAFDTAAIDYLLKPVASERLARALARVTSRPKVEAPPRVTARDRDGLHRFDPARILRFRADEKYTLFEVDGREYLTEQSLSAIEVAHPGFVRVHRAELVAVAAIRRLVTDDDGATVELTDGTTSRVSRRQLPEVKRRLAVLPTDAGR